MASSARGEGTKATLSGRSPAMSMRTLMPSWCTPPLTTPPRLTAAVNRRDATAVPAQPGRTGAAPAGAWPYGSRATRPTAASPRGLRQLRHPALRQPRHEVRHRRLHVLGGPLQTGRADSDLGEGEARSAA